MRSLATEEAPEAVGVRRRRPAATKTVPLVQADSVTLQYKPAKHLLTAPYRASFAVQKADRFALLGPSGCGKSTLLKAVGGYLRPIEGEIRVKASRVTRPAPDRMMVFQEFDQRLPRRTVKENVTFSLLATAKSTGGTEEKAMQYIEKVKLAKFADSFPHTFVRRHEAARGDRPCDGDGARRAAHGRALCRARRAHATQDAGRTPAALGGYAFHGAVRHGIPLPRQSRSARGLSRSHRDPGQVKTEINRLPRDSSGAGRWGWFIYENNNQLEIPNVFAGLLTVSLIGLRVEHLLCHTLERRTVPRWAMPH